MFHSPHHSPAGPHDACRRESPEFTISTSKMGCDYSLLVFAEPDTRATTQDRMGSSFRSSAPCVCVFLTPHFNGIFDSPKTMMLGPSIHIGDHA